MSPLAPALAAVTPGRSSVPKDSLHEYRDWQHPPDKAINSVTLVGPLRGRAAQDPP